MYKITFSRNSGKYELIRKRDGRTMADAPAHDSIFYTMAYHMSQQQPHAAGHLWRAAEEVAAGLVELHKPRNVRSEFDGISFQVATINGYEIREHQREAESVGAPKPAPVYTCNCPFHEKAQSKRPVIAGMPVCKHILAGMMQRQYELHPDHWQTLAAQQQRGRDTFGQIQAKREAEALKMHEDAIINHGRGKARRATFNMLRRQQEEGFYKTPAHLAEQEQPF